MAKVVLFSLLGKELCLIKNNENISFTETDLCQSKQKS